MKYSIFLLFILFTSAAWSKVFLDLKINDSSVKQGQIVQGKILVTQSEGNAALSGLKDKNFAKTLYIHKISPFMMKTGQLEADVLLIFVQVPQITTVTEVINGAEVTISWSGVEVTPVEASKSFLFGDFEIPERLNFLPWILGVLGLGLLIGLILYLLSHFNQKSSAKSRKLRIKEELLGCSSYDEIVLMWRQKNRYLDVFPEISGELKKFEEILFKYQFKSQRSEMEIEEVTKAYQKFKAGAAGVLHGI